jgi:hypothetical protein
MPNYKVLFVGEQKVKGMPWRNREDAARQIVEQHLSVTSIYEAKKGPHFFDVTKQVLEFVNAMQAEK